MQKMNFREGNPFEGKYRFEEISFRDKTAFIVFPPENVKPNKKWVLKTVYFGAFPKLEMEMLDKGFHLAYIDCNGRWGRKDDIEDMAKFCEYVYQSYGLDKKCVPIGMSAGGCVALKLASYYPELVSTLYLDAAVVNLFSCPLGFGKASCDATLEMTEEILDYLGCDKPGILAYRDAPIDRMDKLGAARIPAVIVYGTCDNIVPYDENGAYVERLYREEGIPLLVIAKPGCGHHPHGVADNAEVISFIEEQTTHKS